MRKLHQGIAVLFTLLIVTGVQAQQKDNWGTPNGLSEDDFVPNVIIVKLKTSPAPVGGELQQVNIEGPQTIQDIVVEAGAISEKQLFPNRIKKTDPSLLGAGMKKHDISNIYRIEVPVGQNIFETIARLNQYAIVDYAEAMIIAKPLYLPDDPMADSVTGNQYSLKLIHAYEAWDIEKGDPSVVMGVIDTGTDITHEDMMGNIYYNVADPINGADDDGNGFIDDYVGWDFGDSDNDVTDAAGHGTKVASLCAATTDNGIGMAGTGFNCSYMPIKITSDATGRFNDEYNAIIYAAENGCQLINLSWGWAGYYSQLYQDIFNYVVLELDVIVFAAAGNTDAFLDFYPASYENVISVGMTDVDDSKTPTGTYSYEIDFMAPGRAISSARSGGGYSAWITGSSYATPIALGTAALVRNKYPELSAVQVGEVVRMATDDIYGAPGNDQYIGMLGKGRLNMERAVAGATTPSIRMREFGFENKLGAYAFASDTIQLKGEFVNYLNPTTAGVTVTLSCSSDYITIVNPVKSLGKILSMDTVSIDADPFLVYIHPDYPAGEILHFRYDYADVGYEDFEYRMVETMLDYMTISTGVMAFTIGSSGNYCYDEDSIENGIGFEHYGYHTSDILGLMICDTTGKVLDNAPETIGTTRGEDFVREENLRWFDNSDADKDFRSIFNDSNGGENAMGLTIDQKILAYDGPEDQKYIIVEYRLTNKSDSTLEGLRLGLLADFDFSDYRQNYAEFSGGVGIIGDKLNGLYHGGVAVISGQDPIFNAVELNVYNGNPYSLEIEDGVYTKAEKWGLLLNDFSVPVGGALLTGNDVAMVSGAKLGSLPSNTSTKVAIVFLAGTSQSELFDNLTKAENRYEAYNLNPPLVQTINTCFGQTVVVDPVGTTNAFYRDPLGTDLIKVGASYTITDFSEDQSVYIVNKDNPYDGDITQIQIIGAEFPVDFTFTPDTLYLGGEDRVYFDGSIVNVSEWNWNFNNGYTSAVQNPSTIYDTPGTYDIVLTLTSTNACSVTLTKQLEVIQRGDPPVTVTQKICVGSTSLVVTETAVDIRVYTDAELINMIYDGTSPMVTGIITSDTVFYVVDMTSGYESLPGEAHVQLRGLNPEISFYQDTLNLNAASVMHFEDLDNAPASYLWYVNGNLVGLEKSFDYYYAQDTAMTVKLKTVDDFECQDSAIVNLPFFKSSTPVLEDVNFCKGDAIVLNPAGGIHHFYTDSLETLIYKGSNFDLGLLDSSLTLYVTNAEDYRESDALMVNLTLRPLIEFSMSEDTLTLGGTAIVDFEDLSPDVFSRFWNLGEGDEPTEKTPQKEYTTTGSYDVKLTILDIHGCTDTLTKTIIVLEEITGLADMDNLGIILYPNPVNEILFLDIPDELNLKGIRLINDLGLEIYTTTEPVSQVHLGDYASGVYLLILDFEGVVKEYKIIKQ